ncbi:MAG: hypothetical protein HY700_07525, partial [Gemmatimonadetes bacterium]|nr:hypothetical protein [Gemmatimonadota bacterium]
MGTGTRIRTMLGSLVAVSVLTGSALRTVAAQEPDIRWQAWIGCWTPTDSASPAADREDPSSLVCVTPTTQASSVQLATIDSGQIVAREIIEVSGVRSSARGGCDGWERAEWSPDGRRLYLQSRHVCSGGLIRTSHGVLSITADGDWLDVRGLAAGGSAGVRVMRYRPVEATSLRDQLPGDMVTAVEHVAFEASAARVAAGRRLTSAEVIEATQKLDAVVVRAWLAEIGQRFAVDGHELTRLAGAGVPSSVTDLMIALSYPGAFTVNRRSHETELRPPDKTERVTDTDNEYGYPPHRSSFWDPFAYPAYGFGYPGYGYRYGYGFGSYGWYPGDRVIIVVGAGTPSSTEPGNTESAGKVVKG